MSDAPNGEPPTTLVDANVVLDVVTEDEIWFGWSSDRLAECIDSGRVVINPIIYAEVSVGFESVEDLDEALDRDLERDALPFEAAFLAGKAFLRYRRQGGTRRSPLPDFYIGAHAAIRSYRLLTRDAARYRSYFPTVELLSPDAVDPDAVDPDAVDPDAVDGDNE
jgi:predicted nucleic acid-binding protein